MNALALLNNFERDFARPFFHRPLAQAWLNELSEANTNVFSSEMKYDEKMSAWVLTSEMAGVTKENVKIDTSDSYLEITGEKTKGFNTGKFETRYQLPEGVDTEKVEASFEDGILTVTLPLAEKKRAKTILIK